MRSQALLPVSFKSSEAAADVQQRAVHELMRMTHQSSRDLAENASRLPRIAGPDRDEREIQTLGQSAGDIAGPLIDSERIRETLGGKAQLTQLHVRLAERAEHPRAQCVRAASIQHG